MKDGFKETGSIQWRTNVDFPGDCEIPQVWSHMCKALVYQGKTPPPNSPESCKIATKLL